jgi:hypothetical protein
MNRDHDMRDRRIATSFAPGVKTPGYGMRRSYGAVQHEVNGADHCGQISRETRVKTFRFKVISGRHLEILA